ncbi:MAG: Lrp/AsnC family transcriptional regulator [Oligoflexia bacterium]|nr:Lrp/AsnC family transcriptional regulator [Oligoflexia bacterium]
MPLSERERIVLGACELDAEVSMQEIARRTGYRAHQVAYVLRSLKDRKAVRIRPFVNLMALGYSDYGAFFSLASKSPQARRAIEARIMKHPNVAWCGKMVGEYQYGLSIVVHQTNELEACFEHLEGRNEEVVARKVICPRMRFRLFPRKYLSRYAPKLERVFGHMSGAVAVDDLDKRILYTLDQLEDYSLRRVAQILSVNVRTVERRVQCLREAGILPGFFYDIQPSTLGVETYRVLVTWAGAGQGSRVDLLEFCRAHRQVVFLNEEFGRWDFEIGIETGRASDVSTFNEELTDRFGSSISDLSVMAEVSTLKWSFFPFKMSLKPAK